MLAARGALYTVSDNGPFWLVGVQALDGVGAGIFGALFPVVIADLTKGTGRFNVSQGAVATAQGLGAALSASLAGAIIVGAGYGASFLDAGGDRGGGAGAVCAGDARDEAGVRRVFLATMPSPHFRRGGNLGSGRATQVGFRDAETSAKVVRGTSKPYPGEGRGPVRRRFVIDLRWPSQLCPALRRGTV